MSKVIIAIVAMFALMIFPGAGFWNLLSNVVGGGVAESFLYPIYGGLILFSRACSGMYGAYFGRDTVIKRKNR